MIVDGRNHYPQDIEATASEASAAVRSGFATAFAVPGDGREKCRGRRTRRRAGRAEAAPVQEAIRAAVSRRHALPVADVKLCCCRRDSPASTSGKLARRACRVKYLDGAL